MKISLIFLFFSLPLLIFSQTTKNINEKELLQLPLDSLRNFIDETFDEDIEVTHERCKILLELSRKEDNKDFIISSYLFLVMSTNSKDIALAYCDSLLETTKNLDNHKYPAFAYYMKGEVLYNHHENKQALSELLKANNKITSKTKLFYSHTIKQSIAVIAANTSKHKLAIKYYQESYDYLKENNTPGFLTTLFGLTESHLALNNLDSVSHYINLGMKDSLVMREQNKALFQLSEGRLAYKKGNYIKAKNTLTENYSRLKHYQLLRNLAICSYWIGKSEEKISGLPKAIRHYLKVDSLFNVNQSVPIELRPTWTTLVGYYRSIDDPINELKYARKLIKVDSILDLEYSFITDNITNSFILPNIERENQEEKKTLQKKITKNLNWVLALSFVLFVALILFVIYRKIELKKFQNYKKVIQRLEETKTDNTQDIKKSTLKEETILTIKSKLKEFEIGKAFLDPKTNLNKIAIQLGTNSKYLSMYINQFKGFGFPEYLNKLRIEYVLNRLSKSFVYAKTVFEYGQ